MAYKRSRSEYEADLQAQQSPFVVYGTPMPPFDPEARHDGSYVPIWKQEVTDEQGRKRLHGAFTGGFSAGYFNTVGSKEGWTPSTFASSRSSKQKDGEKKAALQQRPEDFMDEEDLAEAVESQRLHTTDTFAGFGSTTKGGVQKDFLMGLFRPAGETIGIKLLQKMGWRKGQGIGPKIRRKARGTDGEQSAAGEEESHLFAPDDTPMISLTRKDDRHGLGYKQEAKLLRGDGTASPTDEDQEIGPSGSDDLMRRTHSYPMNQANDERPSGGFGVGVMNDNGSDDDDPYEMGPRISYNRVIGGEKRKAKKKPTGGSTPNPLLSTNPVFKPKKLLQASQNIRRCHDGRLPLDGFVISEAFDASVLDSNNNYKVPEIPKGWKSSKVSPQGDASTDNSKYLSTTEAAKESKLDAKARAAILGEVQLPGKSVFDYLSPAARDRLVSASGKANLPVAKGETLPGISNSGGGASVKATIEDIPPLTKEVAIAALSRGVSGWMPYADDDAKRMRYRSFLEHRAGLRAEIPELPSVLNRSSWLQELNEFAHAAQVFKPMTGAMASRFTAATAALPSNPIADGTSQPTKLLSTPSASAKQEDPAEAAARMGMFGPMTRSVHQFFPPRLVCKRFNIKPPDHVQQDADKSNVPRSSTDNHASSPAPLKEEKLLLESSSSSGQNGQPDGHEGYLAVSSWTEPQSLKVNPEQNLALEGQRAGEAVFQAIFGSDDESD